jgi:ribosomal-protein-alanine N-acetyltransferase
VTTLKSLSIRGATAEDAAFIRDLGGEAFGEYSPNAARDTASMAARAHTLIATVGSEHTGFVVVEIGAGTAHLSAIAVKTEARGTGIGRRLVVAAEALARARGASVIGLATADSNLAALELFLRCGFRRRRRHGRYYARGQAAVELVKQL